jgi:hypothetical protein
MVTYGLADKPDLALLDCVMKEWHKDLAEQGVKVGVLMAESNGGGPAVRHGGYAALATVRVVPLKDRLTKGYDAEMLVSAEDWRQMKAPLRAALLDHELSHVQLRRKKKTNAVKRDDLGRPVLWLRKADWNAGDGFRAVVVRHGEAALEFEGLRRAYALASAAKDDGEARPLTVGFTTHVDGHTSTITLSAASLARLAAQLEGPANG